MKSIFTIAIVGAVVLSSCSTYRQGQTPDDVYYSPARQARGNANNSYVQTESGRDEGRRYDDYNNSRSGYSAYDDFATMDDRWLMMRVRNPYRWSAFDDYSYYNSFNPIGGMYNPHFGGGMGWGSGFGYSPGWSFGLGFGSYSPWGFGNMGMGYGLFNNYNNWNSFYNPYYGGYYPGTVVINNYNGKTNPSGYTRARNFDLNRYQNNTNSRFGAARPEYNNANRIRYNNSNNSTLGGSNRRYSNGNEYYRTPSNSSGDRPARNYNPSRSYAPSSGNNSTYSPSSGNSNSGGGGGNSPSSSGGGGGGGSRPSRR